MDSLFVIALNERKMSFDFNPWLKKYFQVFYLGQHVTSGRGNNITRVSEPRNELRGHINTVKIIMSQYKNSIQSSKFPKIKQ